MPISEMEGKLNGYAVLLNYRFMNLCVKAEPAALLPINVLNGEGELVNFEDVANAMFVDQYTFEIVPNSQDLLFQICKSLKMAHPEFKQEIIKAAEENMISEDPTVNEQHVICRMPEVDDDRYDVLMDGVKALYDQCKAECDRIKVDYVAIITEKTIGLPEEDVEEAKNALEERFKMYTDYIDGYRDNKVQEIEEAHTRWLDECQEAARSKQEEENVRGDSFKKGFNMYSDE